MKYIYIYIYIVSNESISYYERMRALNINHLIKINGQDLISYNEVNAAHMPFSLPSRCFILLPFSQPQQWLQFTI